MSGSGSTRKDISREAATKYLRKWGHVGAPLIRQLISFRQITGQRQCDVAKCMKVSPGAISLIEAGKRVGTLGTINRYAHALGLRLILVPKETL